MHALELNMLFCTGDPGCELQVCAQQRRLTRPLGQDAVALTIELKAIIVLLAAVYIGSVTPSGCHVHNWRRLVRSPPLTRCCMLVVSLGQCNRLQRQPDGVAQQTCSVCASRSADAV